MIALRLAALIALSAPTLPQPPIPVRFTLREPGFVTLVIEDAAGRRVRNLVSETRFPAGANTVWWDGTDDLARDPDAARHGVYSIPARPVRPGRYRVRGLVRQAIHLRYEFSVYNGGSPAWETPDGKGGWLTNHTPPQSALFVPGDRAPGGKPLVFLGSFVSEGGSGLAWVDLTGRKVGGRGWVGGNWTAAPFLCADGGARRDPAVYAYVGSPWRSSDEPDKVKEAKGEIRITGLTAGGDKAILKWTFEPRLPSGARPSGDADWGSQMGGMACHDGLMAVSLTQLNQILLVDAREGKVIGQCGGGGLIAPRGLAFDSRGRLLAVCGGRLLRYAGVGAQGLGSEELLAEGLDEPWGIALDAAGLIYITQRGSSHQVAVLSAEGKPLRTIGRPGRPAVGPYDPLHMNNPAGLAVDPTGSVWVTECDYSPKRVSVWTPDGKLRRAFYGPGQYGGGGTLDASDPTRFVYTGMEFRLDWRKGSDTPRTVLYRSAPGELGVPDGYGCGGSPETPIVIRGRRYLTNCYTSNPTNGAAIAMVWQVRGGVARPVAALGRANDWSLLRADPFRARWPAGVDPAGDASRNACLFAWSDLNGDARMQPAEVALRRAATGGVTVMPDLSFVLSRVDDRAMRFAPRRFTAAGTPVYDLGVGETLVAGANGPASSGGDQALVAPNGWTVLTNAPKPFAPEGVGGALRGKPMWSYPSLWPGLHASHEAPAPDRPGQLVGTTRLLGGFVTPRKGEAGPLWSVNGNMGNMYLFTADGLFVATLFRDQRQGPLWNMPVARRGMLLDGLTLHDENFWPSISQTPDGRVILVDGGRTSIVRVDGLETIRRIAPAPLVVTAASLEAAAAWRLRAEAERQRQQGSETLRVAVGAEPPDWSSAEWATIDKRGVAAYFDSNSKPYDVQAALAVSGDTLHAAFRTGDRELLRNSGALPNALFRTGGCLDLMIGADPSADPRRARPVAGDARLLVTIVADKTVAWLYRAVVPGAREPVPFSSPWRTITLDRVEDVSGRVTMTADGKGGYLVAAPLELFGLKPSPGMRIKGDVGILRGNGRETVQRVYWRNKATAITSDIPSEAELTPALWGVLEFGGTGR